MNREDQAYLTSIRQGRPDWEEGRKLAAFIGIDVDNRDKPLYINPEQEAAPKVEQAPAEEPQPEGPGGWRGAVRSVMAGAGKAAGSAAGWTAGQLGDIVTPGFIDTDLSEKGAEIGGDLGRIVATQAIPALAQVPGRIVQGVDFLQDMGDRLANSMFNLVGLGQTPEELKKSMDERKLPFMDVESKDMANAMKWAHGEIFTPPQTEGEKAGREMLTMAAGAMAMGTAGKLAPGQAISKGLFQRAASAGFGDFLVADPDTDKTYETMMSVLSPEARDTFEDYVDGKIGNDEFAEELKKRGASGLVGAVASPIFDYLTGGFRLIGAKRAASRARKLEAEMEMAKDAADVGAVHARVASQVGGEFERLQGMMKQAGLGDDAESLAKLMPDIQQAPLPEQIQILRKMAGEFDRADLDLGVEAMARQAAPVDEVGESTMAGIAREQDDLLREGFEKKLAAEDAARMASEREAFAAERQGEWWRPSTVDPQWTAPEVVDEAAAAFTSLRDVIDARRASMPTPEAAPLAPGFKRQPMGRTEKMEWAAAREIERFIEGAGDLKYDRGQHLDKLVRDFDISRREAEAVLSSAEGVTTNPVSKGILSDPKVQAVFGASTVPILAALMFKAGAADPNSPEMQEAIAALESGDVQVSTAGMLPLDEIVKAVVKVAKSEGVEIAQEAAVKGARIIKTAADETAAAVRQMEMFPGLVSQMPGRNLLPKVRTVRDLENALSGYAAKSAAPAVEATDDVLRVMVDQWGYDRKFLPELLSGGRPDEARLMAGRQMAQDAVEVAQDLAKRHLAGEEVSTEMFHAFNVASAAQAAAVGDGAAAKRAFRLLSQGEDGAVSTLRAGAERSKLFADRVSSGVSTDDFARIMTDASPDDVMRLAIKGADPSWTEFLKEVYYGSKLSSPGTQFKNLWHGVQATAMQISEGYVQAAVNMARGGEGEFTFKEAGDRLAGYIWAFQKSMDVGKARWNQQQVPGLEGMFSGGARFDTARQSVAPEFITERLERMGLDRESPLWKAGLRMGQAINMPGDGLEAVDGFFKAQHYFSELYVAAKGKGLMPDSPEWDAFMRNPPAELAQQLREHAKVMTLTNDLVGGDQRFAMLGKMGENLNTLKSQHPSLMLLTPFVKTQTNGLRYNLQRFPGLNLLDGKMRADLLGRNGRSAQDLAIAQNVIGGTVLGGVALGAANGLITGTAPVDPEDRQAFLAGKMENGMLFGDTWVGYDPNSVLGTLIQVTADTARHIGTMDEEDSMAEVMAQSLRSLYVSMAGATPVLDSLEQVRKALAMGQFPKEEDVHEPLIKELFRIGSGAVSPALWTQTAKLTGLSGSEMQELRDLKDVMNAMTPGAGKVANLDWAGRKRFNGYGYHDRFLNRGVKFVAGVNVRTDELGPVDKMMHENGIAPREPSRIGKVKLNSEQKNKLLSIAGPPAYAAVERFMKQPVFSRLGREQKSVFVKRIIAKYNKAAKSQLMREDPALRKAVTEAAKGNQP